MRTLATYFMKRDCCRVVGEPELDKLFLIINNSEPLPIKRYKTITSYQYKAYLPCKGHNKAVTVPRFIVSGILGGDN